MSLLPGLSKAVKHVVDGNNDNAARHRLQGTEEDLKIADQYDRESVQLRASLTKALASVGSEDEAVNSMENKGGATQ